MNSFIKSTAKHACQQERLNVDVQALFKLTGCKRSVGG